MESLVSKLKGKIKKEYVTLLKIDYVFGFQFSRRQQSSTRTHLNYIKTSTYQLFSNLTLNEHRLQQQDLDFIDFT